MSNTRRLDRYMDAWGHATAKLPLRPSEYFRRQIYASFWFEEQGIAPALEMFPDNILYETDYPHPTCQAPGPASVGTRPQEYAERAMAGISDDVVAKVMHDSAAALYGIA